MQKHLLLRLLAVLLGFTLVASACGDDDSDSGEAADSSSDSSDDSADDSEDVVEATQDGSVLAAVVARGELNCGVSGAGVGFSVTQPDGSQVGFDADYCRATAAAILGDADAVNFVPLTAAERFTAVQTGQVDVLFRNTTWTQSRDTDVGMDFGPTTYFDGQQLMGRAGDGFSGASGVADIDGAVVAPTPVPPPRRTSLTLLTPRASASICRPSRTSTRSPTPSSTVRATSSPPMVRPSSAGRPSSSRPTRNGRSSPVSRSRRSRLVRPTARTSPGSLTPSTGPSSPC